MNSDFNAVQTLAREVDAAAAANATITDDGDDNSRLEAKRRRQDTTTTTKTAPPPAAPAPSSATTIVASKASEATVIQQQQHRKNQQQASQIHQHYQQQQLTLNHRDPEASANQLSEQPEPATIVNRGGWPDVCGDDSSGGNSSKAQSGGCSQVGPANQQPQKPCNICHHQEILATPQAPESNQQQQQSPLPRQSKQKRQHNPNCDKGCSLLATQSSSARCSRQQHCAPEQQSSASVAPAAAVATAAADQVAADQQQAAIESLPQQQIDNFNSNNSFLFWKFLSNLPKSITQRSKSTTLAPEVAGYLASKQLQLQQQQQQLESQCNHHQNVMTVASLDEPKNKGAQLIQQQQQQQQQFHHQYQMRASSKAAANEPQLVGCTQLSQDGQRLIKIVAPPTALLPLQDAVVFGQHQLQQSQPQLQQQQDRLQCHQMLQATSPNQIILAGGDGDLQAPPTPHKHSSSSSANQQQLKLSIATTTTTTRSCNSSLSSCILSDSSTSENRLRWDKKMDFLLSIIGFAVDLANMWRFPYLVYKNGGGVFLIPYVIMLIFGGIPLFFLELCLGQFVKKGPITVWNKICPAMKGVGYCSILISWYVSFYYNVLIAWSVYFIYRSLMSFGDKMPWEHCNNPWNTQDKCLSISGLREKCAEQNSTLDACRKELFGGSRNVTSPASDFFVKELSQIDQSSGLDDLGILVPELVLCLIVVYLLHYFSLFRGLETSGKVVWVTATAPYMILSVLLVRGLFLPGASMGIEYYLSPKLERLSDPTVWIDAANQVFFSIGVGFGVHLTYASFNSHNNDCYRDCLVTSAANAATSVYTGLVVFVYLGYMAKNLGIEIDKVASEGYTLVFEVYPEALATFPFARFWTILFFIMLLTLGIDSAMGGLEAVITGLEDEFKFAKRLSRWQLTALVIVSSFLPALVGCTQGGPYVVFWLDLYSAGCSLLLAALFETIGVVYCYGLDKFILNIESMLGKKPHVFYIVCWKYISPLFLAVVIIMSILQAQVPVYRGYTFPMWSVILGWCLAFSSVAAVPIVAIWHFCSKTPEKSSRRRDKGGGASSSAVKTVSVSCGSGGQAQRAQTTRTAILTTTSHSML